MALFFLLTLRKIMNFMNWKNRHTPLLLLLITLVATALTGCSTSKFVPEDRYLLDAVQVRTDSKELDAAQFGQYVRQKGNSHWFSLFKIPLGTYSLAGRDSTKWLNRTLRHIGEEPVVYDSLEAARSCADLRLAMQNMGYMNSYVDFETQVRGRKLKAIYTLHPGDPYRISSFRYDIPDSAVAQVLAPVFGTGDQQVGEVFTVSSLDNLRKRIATVLNDSGFYRFHKDFVTYTADSLQGTQGVNLVCRILPYRENSSAPPKPHPRYRVRSIHYRSSDGYDLPLRRSVLAENTVVKAGEWFSASDLQRTYNNFARLGAVRYTNITFREDTLHNLDTDIRLSMRKPNTIAFQPEGTNTAGDFGAAATLTYQNRNLFRGSELLSIELRGAFEAIKGLEGYERGDYEEYGVEARFQMPRLMTPFLSRKGRRGSTASTELSVAWNLQNRPEFHRRVFSAGLKYRWPTRDGRVQYKLDVLDLSYVYMPWISATFKHDYLDSVSNRNAILRYNYEDLFIMKAGFGLTYNAGDRVIRASVETAGNLLSGFSQIFRFKQNSHGQRQFFNIAYAQYAKFDFEYTRLLRFSSHNTLALHGLLGVAWPYGNSTVLPFEKRYFSGGANSVRGWSVRELGPGKYRGRDGRIDFINQTGDMRLDLNLEYRTHLFWKFDGAAFVDAGNIWTLRSYPEQPGGQFQLDTFFKQIAVSYGLGLRLNFGYFILRLDGAMKAINPAYDDHKDHYPIFHPRWGRDFAFHFAVGMPF
jgi:outer membrane protein assembly factor BamA